MAEVAILALLLFVLPLFEAPKNIFSGLLILVFLGLGLWRRGFGRASPLEWPIWVLLAAALLGPMTSEYAGQIGVFASAQHWLLLGLTAIVAGRLAYGAGQWRVLLAALILGGVIAVLDSYWVWSWNGKPYPEFRSVGHVNHSALYMLAVLAAGLAAFRDNQRWMWLLGAAGVVASFAYFIPSRSLVAMGAGLVVTAVGLALILHQFVSRQAMILSVLAVALGFAALLATPPAAQFRAELHGRITGGNLLSYRQNIFFTAYEVFDRNPAFGTDVRSFNMATDAAVLRAELAAEGRDFDAEAARFYLGGGHGHNLWTTLLVERGIVGVLAATAYLVIGMIAFARLHRALGGDGVRQSAARAGLLMITCLAVAGLGNTTMIVEHAQAAMLLVAIAWGAAQHAALARQPSKRRAPPRRLRRLRRHLWRSCHHQAKIRSPRLTQGRPCGAILRSTTSVSTCPTFSKAGQWRKNRAIAHVTPGNFSLLSCRQTRPPGLTRSAHCRSTITG